MAYKGQTVHYWYRGTCNPALVVDFWEEATIARLMVFQPGGAREVGRTLQGSYGQDEHWHHLVECADIDPAELSGGVQEGEDNGRGKEGSEGTRSEQAVHVSGTAGDRRLERQPRRPADATAGTDDTGLRSGRSEPRSERGPGRRVFHSGASPDGDDSSGGGGVGPDQGTGPGRPSLDSQQSGSDGVNEPTGTDGRGTTSGERQEGEPQGDLIDASAERDEDLEVA